MAIEEPPTSFWCPDESCTFCESETTCDFCCPAYNNFLFEGCNWCNESPATAIHPCCGPPGHQCIVCYICFAPFAGIIDLITLPVRTTIALKRWCCCSNKTEG